MANFKNALIFIAINIIAFALHYWANLRMETSTQWVVVSIPISYATNALLSLSICVSIFFLNRNFEAQIGFIFLGLSVLKMLILFFVLNPTNASGEVETKDALSLFVPFGINLVMEQLFIVKLLKISDLTKTFKKE
ncbi:DUF6168 family protein [Wenyingzhuangia sp. IMCC45533]